MPAYDYFCPDCETVTEFFHGMQEKLKEPCPACGKRALVKQYSMPRVQVPGADLHTRNGGRGEYLGQCAARPDVKEPGLYYKSKREAVEIAKRHGFTRIET